MPDELPTEHQPSAEELTPGADAEGTNAVLPFGDLQAPTPLSSTPPPTARWLAFLGVLVGGFLGGIIGYGVTDLQTSNSTWAAFGGLVGGLIGAIGVGVVSSLTLRAMNEWHEVQHPEEAKGP